MIDYITCRETLTVQTSRIMPNDTNSFGNMYGGELLKRIDNVSSVAATRFSRSPVMTASVDSMNFLRPLPENHSVCLEAYVTGAGSRSMEVFVKVISEDLENRTRTLAATAFVTFVTVSRDGSHANKVPKLKAESAEEIYLTEGYANRRESRLAKRYEDQDLANHLSTDFPWNI